MEVLEASQLESEKPANAFSGTIINISLNPEYVFVHKSLDTIESSSIIKSFTSDKLFFKATLDFSFKPSNYKTKMNGGSTYIYC